MKLFFLFFSTLSLSFAATYILTSYMKQQAASPAPSVFSLQNPPRNALKGKITSLTGDTFWQSRIATTPAQLTAARDVLQGENLLTKQTGHLTMTFPDVETVVMQPNTEVDIIQTLPANLIVAQQDGEVLYTKRGSTPFSVNALSLLINHQQGIMNVSVDKEEKTVTAIVQTGLASLSYADATQTTHVVSLTPGRSFFYDATTQTGVMNRQK